MQLVHCEEEDKKYQTKFWDSVSYLRLIPQCCRENQCSDASPDLPGFRPCLGKHMTWKTSICNVI